MHEEFERIYQDLYNKHFNKLERIRRNVILRAIIQSFFIIIIGFKIKNIEYVKMDDPLILISILIIMVLLYFSSRSVKKYKEIYKKNIISNLIKRANNKLEYKPTSTKDDYMEDEYRNANFDNKHFNHFYQDDYIEGVLYKDIFGKIVNIRTQIKLERGFGRYSLSAYQFKGIFSHLKYDKGIGTYIKISKNANATFKYNEKIEIESTEFEKYFDVDAENKTVMKQLLTSNTMMLLMDFYDKCKINYDIVVKDNNIYMRFFMESLFEPKIFDKSIDKELLLQYYCTVKFINNIAEEFDRVLKEM